MRINDEIMISMIRDYFKYKDNKISMEQMDAWNRYPIKIESYQIEEKKIFTWYKIKWDLDREYSLNCVRIDKADYIRQVANRESFVRNKKIDSILKEKSFFDKIKDKFI